MYKLLNRLPFKLMKKLVPGLLLLISCPQSHNMEYCSASSPSTFFMGNLLALASLDLDGVKFHSFLYYPREIAQGHFLISSEGIQVLLSKPLRSTPLDNPLSLASMSSIVPLDNCWYLCLLDNSASAQNIPLQHFTREYSKVSLFIFIPREIGSQK